MMRSSLLVLLAVALGPLTLAADEPPTAQAFQVFENTLPMGPRVTPYLQYQTEQAWKQDDLLSRFVPAASETGIRRAGLGSCGAGRAQPILGFEGGEESLQSDLRGTCGNGQPGVSGGRESCQVGNLGRNSRRGLSADA